MRSSYSLIKKDNALSGEAKVISTTYKIETPTTSEDVTSEVVENIVPISNYENIGQNIIKEAQRKKETIMIEALKKAEELEKEAYHKGYNQGKINGYEDGKKEAIESVLPEAEADAKEIIEKANKILRSAREDYDNYLRDKKEEIIKLSICIAEKILKTKVQRDDGLNDIIESSLEMAKGEDNIIVRCNPIYEEALRNKVELWKTVYNITGEIFLLVTDDMEPGNVIIEKTTGKIKVGVETGLENIINSIIG